MIEKELIKENVNNVKMELVAPNTPQHNGVVERGFSLLHITQFFFDCFMPVVFFFFIIMIPCFIEVNWFDIFFLFEFYHQIFLFFVRLASCSTHHYLFFFIVQINFVFNNLFFWSLVSTPTSSFSSKCCLITSLLSSSKYIFHRTPDLFL